MACVYTECMKNTGKKEVAARVAYSVRETALATGKTTNAVYLQIQAGKIPTARIGTRLLVASSHFTDKGLSLPKADKDNA